VVLIGPVIKAITSFSLVNYDLAKEKGIVLSLLQSHISQFNKDASPHSIWCEILAEVQNFNQSIIIQ
jgi:hypothetical protein